MMHTGTQTEVINEEVEKEEIHSWVKEAYSPNIGPITPKEALAILIDRSVVTIDSPPELPILQSPGSCTFLLQIENNADWTRDALSPWFRKAKGEPTTAPKWSKHSVNTNMNITLDNNETAYTLRCIRGRHPLFDCYRTIYQLTLPDSKTPAPCTDRMVLYHYYFPFGANIEQQPMNIPKRIKPSEMKTIKDELAHKSTEAAYNVLKNIGVTKLQIKNASRSVPTVIKKKTGPRFVRSYYSKVTVSRVNAIQPNEECCELVDVVKL